MEENFVSFSRVLRLLDISFYDFEGESGASYLEVRMGLKLDNSNRVRTCGLKTFNPVNPELGSAWKTYIFIYEMIVILSVCYTIHYSCILSTVVLFQR